ncbi:MAG: hypothetical protein IKR43_06470 [Lachnospiraceae bacterium]|nr:hypothetical protein [Lachnospiraceae bacterium]
MKVIALTDFFDLAVMIGRRAGEAIEVPEDRGTRLIAMRLAKAEEEAEKPRAAAKPAAKRAEKKN